MHDIIKKALDEALTEKYHAELMGCAETDYNFSVGFVADMKALIRKTDNKLIYYSKYIAAAACAVIAIGCAVLLPNLMDSSIDVEPPVTGTTSATSVKEDTPGTTTSLSPDSANPIVTDSTTPTVTTPDESTATTTEPAVPDDTEYSPGIDDTDSDTQNGTVSEETPPVDIPEDDEEVEGDSSSDTITDDDISEDEIYTFVSTIFDNADQLQHGKAAELSLEFASSISSVPYHPGAARYFAERALTSPERLRRPQAYSSSKTDEKLRRFPAP